MKTIGPDGKEGPEIGEPIDKKNKKVRNNEYIKFGSPKYKSIEDISVSPVSSHLFIIMSEKFNKSKIEDLDVKEIKELLKIFNGTE